MILSMHFLLSLYIDAFIKARTGRYDDASKYATDFIRSDGEPVPAEFSQRDTPRVRA
jgi:hypothetical protein